MGTDEILRIVTEGDFNYLEKTNLLVQEGLTIPEVASRVAEVTGATPGRSAGQMGRSKLPE